MKVNIDFSRRAEALARRMFERPNSYDEGLSDCFRKYGDVRHFLKVVYGAVTDSVVSVGEEYQYGGLMEVRLKPTKAWGEYHRHTSSEDHVILGLDIKTVVAMVAGVDMDYTLRRLVEHEYRHHVDRAMMLFSHDLLDANWEDWYIFDYLKDCRVEGFADFKGAIKLQELVEESKNSRKIVDKVVKGVIEDIYTEKDKQRFEPDRYVGSLEPGFSSYVQGALLMDTIALAWYEGKFGKQEKLEMVREVTAMGLRKFYKTYFNALRQLGMVVTDSVVPKTRTMKLMSMLEKDK